MATETLTAQKAAEIAVQEMDSCEKTRQPRLLAIQEMLDAYYGKFRPQLMGRSNVSLPFFAKYVDEIKSRIDESPTIKFGHTRQSQVLLAKKVQAACDKDRKPSLGDWNRKDRMSKLMAIFSGIGVYDYFAESTPEYHSNLEPVDIFDFYFDPTGGSDLEDHSFVGKGPFYRSKAELDLMVDEGVYDEKMVNDVISAGGSDDYKVKASKFLTKYKRAEALGMQVENSYVGERFFPLMQWQMTIGGKRYFLVFEAISGKPVRFEPLKKVFGSNLYSMVMWQTHEDPTLVLSKSPADDIWPIAEWLRVMGNYMMDAQTKKIWGQRAYDPDFFPDPSQLIWSRPDQLIQAKAAGGRPISEGVYQFQIEDDSSATINVLEYFENLMASTAGVAPQDPSNQDQKVGVMFGNLQKVSARMGVYNHSYNECWNKIAMRYVWGLKDNMSESRLVKIVGENGVEWDELKKDELTNKTEFDIEVVGSNVELEMSEAKKTKQMQALESIEKDQGETQELNTKVVTEEKLRVAGFSEATIARMMNTQNYGSEKSISHAAQSIEKILKLPDLTEGTLQDPNALVQDPKAHVQQMGFLKKVPLYRAADVAFVQYILDFVTNNDLKPEKAIMLMQYGRAHQQIVVRNMAMKASIQMSQKGIAPPNMQPPQAPPINAIQDNLQGKKPPRRPSKMPVGSLLNKGIPSNPPQAAPQAPLAPGANPLAGLPVAPPQ